MRHSPLALWHLLSLDAPTVAALWTWFVARSCGIALPFAGVAAMFLAVWVLYAADRLLDALGGEAAALEERHRFHERHRRTFVGAIAVAAVLLAWLTPQILPQALRLYGLLGALLAGWFVLIHTRLAGERRLPKEIAVGMFFAAAIFIPTVARRPELRVDLLFPAAVFAAVCGLNCMYLYAWEHPADGDRAQANWTTRVATEHLSATAGGTLGAALAGWGLTAVGRFEAAHPGPIFIACAGSVVLLALIHFNRGRLSPIQLRAVGDLALLTPLAVAPMFLALGPR